MTHSKKYLTKIVGASLLGDGCVHIPPKGYINAVYSTSKTEDHADYIYWLGDVLGTLTHVNYGNVDPLQFTSVREKQKAPKKAITLRTRSHPFYTNFRNRMYGTGRKTVDPHYLTLLDWEFLAVWFQEDGSLTVRRRQEHHSLSYECHIHSQSFSYGDNMVLRRALKEKLNLDWNVRKDRSKSGEYNYFLALSAKNVLEFCENLEPYIQPSFKYKVSATIPSCERVKI